MFSTQPYGAFHRRQRIQVSRSTISVPALERAKACYSLRSGLHIHTAVANRAHEAGKAVYAVRVHAIARCLGKQARAGFGSLIRQAKPDQHAGKRTLHFIKRKSVHLSGVFFHSLRFWLRAPRLR